MDGELCFEPARVLIAVFIWTIKRGTNPPHDDAREVSCSLTWSICSDSRTAKSQAQLHLRREFRFPSLASGAGHALPEKRQGPTLLRD
jgi:hypothetical protein